MKSWLRFTANGQETQSCVFLCQTVDSKDLRILGLQHRFLTAAWMTLSGWQRHWQSVLTSQPHWHNTRMKHYAVVACWRGAWATAGARGKRKENIYIFIPFWRTHIKKHKHASMECIWVPRRNRWMISEQWANIARGLH